MRPPRPAMAASDGQTMDRVARAHAAMAGGGGESEEDSLLSELDAALKAADAALQKLRAAQGKEKESLAPDADTGSPSMQGAV